MKIYQLMLYIERMEVCCVIYRKLLNALCENKYRILLYLVAHIAATVP